jgi:hypothetical protein
MARTTRYHSLTAAQRAAALTEAIAAATASGDLRAARIAHEALKQRIAEPETCEGRAGR